MSNYHHNSSEKNGWSEGSSGEGATDQKQTFGSKLKRNCGKFWWLYLLILIIVVIVIVIPIIFVGIRNVAQGELDKATVEVNQQSATNPGPNSFDLVINSTVTSNTDKHATVEAFNGSYYLLDTKDDIKPFIYAEFPEVMVEATNEVNIGQPKTYIADMDQFIAYNKLALSSETFQIGIRGHPKLIVDSNLPKYTVTWDKVVTMKGFNKFAGFNIDTIQFHNPPEFDGATMTGTVSIPNPTVITAQFGNVTMDLYSNGTYLGYSLLQYVELQPGDNTFDMRGYVDLTTTLPFVQNYLLDLDIVGNSSVNIIGEHLVYYEEALRANTIHYQLNLTAATSTPSQELLKFR